MSTDTTIDDRGSDIVAACVPDRDVGSRDTTVPVEVSTIALRVIL